MRSPLGKNKIGKFLSKAADNVGLQRAGGKLGLLDAKTPEIFVAQLSGDKNL